MGKKCKFILVTIAAVLLVCGVRTGLLLSRYPEVDIDVTQVLAENGAALRNVTVSGNELFAETNDPELWIDLPEEVPVYEIGIQVDKVSRANCRSYVYLFPSYQEASILLKDGMNYWRFENRTAAGATAQIRFDPVPLRAVSLTLESITINPHGNFILSGCKDAAILAAALAILEGILLALWYRRDRNGGWYQTRMGTAAAVISGGLQTAFTGAFLYLYIYERHSWDVFQTAFYFTFFITESLFVLLVFLPDTLRKREFPVLRILLLSVMGYAMTETLYGDYMQHFKLLAVICNPLAFSLLYALFRMIPFPKRWHLEGLCYALPAVLWMLAAGVNHYYFEFRAQALEFADISMAGTAGNVMGTYTLDVTGTVFMMYVSAAAVAFAALTESKANWHRRNLTHALVCVLYLAVAGIFLWTHTPTVSLWNTNTATKYNGYVYSFLSYMQKSLERPVPDGYAAEEANAILASYAEDSAAADEADSKSPDETTKISSAADRTSSTETGSVQATNLIVVMDEAFADLPTTYGFETTIDGMPFIHALEGSNVKKGEVMVSVFGGTTADSEYEFLTGNSLAFLNADSVPYTQYIDSSQQSLATMLEARGVYTTAFHPYLPNGYKRNKIYPLLGFSQFVSSEDDLQHRDKMRSYISDAADMEDLIDIYENNKAGVAETAADGSGEPSGEIVDASHGQFIFNVTMQNHGNYSSRESAVDVTVEPTDALLQTPQLEEYLSLAYATDQAFADLIAYYEQVEEPTIILFFGDHQPGMDESVYKRLNPAMYEEDAPLEEIQKKYTVPYVIWANYDLPDLGDIDGESRGLAVTSTNFLRSYFLENAGVELSAWDRLCSAVREEYPALNSKGFLDTEGVWHDNDELSGISLMQDYQKVCYLNLFDKGHMEMGYFE